MDDWKTLPELGNVDASVLPSLPFRGVLLIWQNGGFYDAILSIQGDPAALGTINMSKLF